MSQGACWGGGGMVSPCDDLACPPTSPHGAFSPRILQYTLSEPGTYVDPCPLLSRGDISRHQKMVSGQQKQQQQQPQGWRWRWASVPSASLLLSFVLSFVLALTLSPLLANAASSSFLACLEETQVGVTSWFCCEVFRSFFRNLSEGVVAQVRKCLYHCFLLGWLAVPLEMWLETSGSLGVSVSNPAEQ